MDARDLQRYKRLLNAKLEELSVSGFGPSPAAMAAGGPRGDYIDQANAEADAMLNIQLRQSNAGLVRAIEDALARISRGTFGLCEDCQNAISKARLEAVPWSPLCRDCKEREQSAA
jgi:DnaK suppressor protein